LDEKICGPEGVALGEGKTTECCIDTSKLYYRSEGVKYERLLED
jgi:hypothetical protein